MLIKKKLKKKEKLTKKLTRIIKYILGISNSQVTLDWIKHKLESRLPGEISITSDMQMTPSHGRKRKRAKEPLDESQRRQ